MQASPTLSHRACEAITDLLGAQQPWEEAPAARLRFHGTAPAFDTPHALTLSAGAAIGAYALAVEKWWHLATGQRQTVAIDWMQAASSLNPGHFQTQNGYGLPALSLLTELKADFYRTADQRWFFPIGSYPHLRDGVLELLDCANTPAALSRAIGRWKGDDLEAAFEEKRLPGVYARSTEEWLRHPQGALLAQRPVIEITRIADSDPEPARPGARPLSALRVLDLGHVIAGPVVARSLAEHGAEVLRVTPPMNQDPFRQTIDTNIGKQSAFLDLTQAADQQRARELVSGADVVVQSWRPGSLARRGLGAEDAAALRPGVIYVSVSAFGDSGPWAERGGFEQLGQTVTGIAISEGVAGGKPRVVPTYLLNDYLTGYLGAAGVMLALLRRAVEGGSYHVKVSLTRTSMWVQGLGLEPGHTPREDRRHFAEGLLPLLETRPSAYGVLQQLPPVAQFSHTRAHWALPPAPNGAHPAAWLHRPALTP
ncbi:CoA transferase [Achromobacter aloeverae]|uniref:Acyl-CoA hydratase n=1 Tax=Achromobacter aloeverae TaxID=1750518 RepID=A0A4Q1HF91_9BURK|nr:CoA transferase [Achromobacter aloeverae]RXN85343.1 acyl-CoA hydratase [Achromobacter aloeverae]